MKHQSFLFGFAVASIIWSMILGMALREIPQVQDEQCPEEIQMLPTQGSLQAVYGVVDDTVACVTVTCYNPVPAQTNSEYWITASGAKIDTLNPLKHRWVAVSRDLESKGIKLHDTIHITGVGIYDGQWIVKDRMNKRWTDRIDLLVGENNYIAKWTEVSITLK